MQALQFKKKKEENIQLLLLYQRLLDLEESCWTKLFRFQKTQFFVEFQKKYSVPGIINLRLDDFIFFLLLAIMETIFGVLPMDASNPFTTPYRQSLALFFLTSFIAVISPHWFRWVTLFVFCFGYPGLIYLTVNGYINLMPLNTGINIFNYMGYLSLAPIFIFLVLIYPLKQFIRRNAGSMYSYVYALALSLIIYLWPFYSFISELTSSGSISFTFITNNQPLLTAFIILVVTGFYFFIHHALFQPKLERVQEMLLEEFTQAQLNQAVEQVEESEIVQTSCLYRHFHFFVRSMSFIIYSLTIALELYLYFKLVNNTTEMTTLGVLMGYILLFQLFGAVYIYVRVKAVVALPIIAILSLGTAVSSFFYYNSSTNFYIYVFISISGPFIAIFWSLIKNTSDKSLIFRTNSIIILFLTIFIPVIALTINKFNFFTSDSDITNYISYILIAIIGVTLLLLLVMFIIWQVKKHKLQKKEEDKSKPPVDYNYFQEGQPEYKYYEVKQQYGMGYLANIDLREIGYIVGLIFFILSQLLSIHAVNLLRTELSSTTFYSPIIKQLIYSQFFNIFLFYVYTHCFLVNPDGNFVRIFFLIVFIVAGIGSLVASYLVDNNAMSFQVVFGFSIVMIVVLVALEYIKGVAEKIFGFVSSIIVLALWIFIVLPYVEVIPFVSLFASQTEFGNFIYGCIIGSVILLILMVGILTLVFNRLIDKFQEEKKFKFMMQDVITLFQEQGVQAHDEQLHVLYQSFMYRDKKYVFFLKRGFPLNLLQDPDDHITKLVASSDYLLKKVPTKKQLEEEQKKKRSLLWNCLTCCCGEDEEQIQEKLTKAKKEIDGQELMLLLPRNIIGGLMRQMEIEGKKKKKKWKSPAQVYSSKSLVLKDLHYGPRYLGDEYILLKTGKNADMAIEIWHNIFDFAANTDEGQSMIISNDFHLLLEIAKVNIDQKEVDELFFQCANSKWGIHSGMNLQDFSLAIEAISAKQYQEKGEQGKFYLLINTFFYNLAAVEEFNNFLIEKKTKKRVTKSQIKNSPFQQSYHQFKSHRKQKKEEETHFMKKVNKFSSDKHLSLEPVKEGYFGAEKEAVEQKGTSCKKMIFQKVKACESCCKKQEIKDQFQRKLFVRPWVLVSLDAVRIMQKKENDWDSVVDIKEHPFRMTSNNILMAAVKFVDIFTYVSISVLNPQIGWLDGLTSNNLYLNYFYQIYLAVAVVAVSVPFGIRGIMLIFQDRLGLTESRLPAAFPHPMFFFTLFYKLIILSLFNIVSQTFLTTFHCDWTSSTQPYTLIDDPSVQCFSSSHNKMVIISLIGLISYYPLSSYAMPNFQFAEKSLDLKYRPSYLILYFQANFILLTCKVLLSGSSSHTTQIVNGSISIFVLTILGISVWSMKPCFIMWFNWVEMAVIMIGLVVNVMGFVLYLTGLWTLCAILAGSLSGTVMLLMIIIIKKGYFSAKVSTEKIVNEEQYKELEMMWESKQRKQKIIMAQGPGIKGLNAKNKEKKQDFMKKGSGQLNQQSSSQQQNTSYEFK